MRWRVSTARALFVGLALSVNLFVSYSARSQSAATLRDPLPIAKLFPTLPLDKWVGQKVQFLAAPVPIAGDLRGTPINVFGWMRVKTAAEIEKETYRHGDVVERIEIAPNTSDPNYIMAMRQELDGKVATIISVDKIHGDEGTEKIVTVEVDRSKRRYTCAAYGNTIDQVVFLREVDAARRLFQGATLYCRERSLLTFHGKEIVRVPVENFAPVVVQDVVPATNESTPLRFLLKTRDGKHAFADVHLGSTNIAPSLLQYDSFATTFVVTDPRRVYHWKAAVWSAIKKRQPLVGMTSLQVILSEGKPYKIDDFVGGQTWTYYTDTDKETVIFKNGIVRALLRKQN